jgi:hypothetical protein
MIRGVLPGFLVFAAFAQTPPPEGQFRVGFDQRGITSLKYAGDKYDTEYIAAEQTLGAVRVRYKMGDNEWRQFSTTDASNKYQPLRSIPSRQVVKELAFTLNPQDWRRNEYYADLELTERFRVEPAAMYWTIFLRNPTHKPIVLGDVFLPLPFNMDKRWDKKISYEERLVQHQWISGHASWVYWMRPNGVGPYLVMTPVAACPLFEPQRSEMNFAPGKLEYADRGGVYILSGRRGEEDRARGGTWRQPQTMVTLAPANSQRDGVTYAFKFQWAKDYDGVRDILYREGLLDVNVVPGMTVPLGLDALVSIRTKSAIASVDPEFPQQTRLESLGEKTPGTHLYKVTFSKLGENKLTVHFGRKQYAVLEFFVTEPLVTVIRKRAAFISAHQQHRDPGKWWNGLFSEWDMVKKVLRSPEDRDGLADYILASDDPALCKAPFVAMKNVDYPVASEIESVEYYLKNFVWGKLQMTDKEKYPYGIYGIDNWKINRESKPQDRYGWVDHVWRPYDYPHVISLYWSMYQIAGYYPELVHYLTKEEYLERAYGTALAFYTYPKQIANWSTNELGHYNELVIPKIIGELEAAGQKEKAATLRRYWESKIEYFVNDQPDLFYSEYPFDPTAFESTGAFAHYAIEELKKPAGSLKVKPADVERFVQEQLACNMATRGYLEPAYWQLGVEGNMRYMSQMGGWSILDYGLYYAKDPYPYLRLGYASILSSWALVNSGTPETNYGFFYPGKDNDGAAGSAFVPQSYGANWFGKSQPRGPWQYSGEIDLGFMGGLRGAATVVADDPVFGLIAYGGRLARRGRQIEVTPQDGINRRFHIITDRQRFHLLLERDGFAAGQPLRFDDDLREISFTLENRDSDPAREHRTALSASGLPAGAYAVEAGGRVIANLAGSGTVELTVRGNEGIPVSLRRVN